MLLDSLDKIRYLPEERIHRLEWHRLAIVREASLGLGPGESLTNDGPRLAIEFHAIGALKHSRHGKFNEQTTRVAQDQRGQFVVDAVMHRAEQPTADTGGPPKYQRHRSIRWVPTPLKAQ